MSVICPSCGNNNLFQFFRQRKPSSLLEYYEIARCTKCSCQFILPGDQPEPEKQSAPKTDKSFSEAIPFAIQSAIVDALDHARTTHPVFADTFPEAANVILEELLEVDTAALNVVRSINDQNSRDNLLVELAQLNATTIRMMEMILK